MNSGFSLCLSAVFLHNTINAIDTNAMFDFKSHTRSYMLKKNLPANSNGIYEGREMKLHMRTFAETSSHAIRFYARLTLFLPRPRGRMTESKDPKSMNPRYDNHEISI